MFHQIFAPIASGRGRFKRRLRACGLLGYPSTFGPLGATVGPFCPLALRLWRPLGAGLQQAKENPREAGSLGCIWVNYRRDA